MGNENVVRHIDFLLAQAECIIGKVAYCHIYKFAKSNGNQNIDTLGHIMLENHRNHKQLAFMLNGFNFHGQNLLAVLCHHRFSSIDDEYIPIPIKQKCSYCNKFEQFVVEKVENIKQEAIQNSIQKVSVYKPHHRETYHAVIKLDENNKNSNVENQIVEGNNIHSVGTNSISKKRISITESSQDDISNFNTTKCTSRLMQLGRGRSLAPIILQTSRSSTPQSTANTSIMVIEEPQEDFEMINHNHQD